MQTYVDGPRVDSEMAVLGLLLRGDPDGIRSRLVPADFVLPRHSRIYGAIRSLSERSLATDFVAVEGELRRQGVRADEYGTQAYLLDLLELSNTVFDLAFHADQVVDGARRRRLEDGVRHAQQALKDGRPADEVADLLRATVASSAPEPDGENHAEGEATNPFPLGALPRAVASFCASISVAHAIDPAFVAVPALAALAGAVAGTRRITIKAGTWAEPAHLWCGLVAPSGSGKSPAQNAVLEPLRRRDADLARRTKLDLEAHKGAVAAWRSGGSQGPEPAAPPQRQALLDDCTVEAAMARLVDNPRGLLLAADELAAFLRSFDKYRQGGGDLSRWLSIHNGGAIRVDRKGVGSAYLERAVVGVVGGIQPSVARELLGADTHSLSGFTARFLLAAPPTSAACWSDTEVDLMYAQQYRRVVDGLLDLELHEGQPVDLSLTPDGRSAFQTWHNELANEAHLAGLAGHEALAAVYSKLKGATARVALVVQLAADAEQGIASMSRSVGAEAMEKAVQMARYFRNEARRIFREWGGRTSTATSKVEAVLTDEWTPRADLHRQLGNIVPAAELTAALHHLGAECRQVPTKGRPREEYRRKQMNEESRRPAPHQSAQPSGPRGGLV